VIEQDPVAGIHSIGLAIINGNPIGVKFGDSVWASGIKWSRLTLGDFLDKAIKFTGGSLINTGAFNQAKQPHCLKNSKRAHCIAIGGIFRAFKAYCDMALGAKIVNLIRLYLLYNSNQIGRVREITIMKNQLRIDFMWILIKMIDAICVEAARATLQSVDNVSLL
jgi:hypothetical protein